MMTEASLSFSWAEFDAQHAFLRDEAPRYDPEFARQCYGMAVDLFRRRLGSTGSPNTPASRST